MTTETQVQQCLTELKPLYKTLKRQYEEWEALQEVPKAKADYEKARDQEAAKSKERLIEQLNNLRQRRDDLKREIARLSGPATSNGDSAAHPSVVIAAPIGTQGNVATQEYLNTQEGELEPPPLTAQTRENLLKLANWWRNRLSQETLRKINRIAESDHLPLGEALILLDWDTFYAYPDDIGDKPEKHLKRLQAWEAELRNYENVLDGQLADLRSRHRNVLGIWEKWRERKTNPEVWQEFLEQTCQQQVADNIKLADDIAVLGTDIIELEARRDGLRQAKGTI